METRANHFWVGAFALAVLAALFAAVYWFSGRGLNGEKRDLMVRFEGSVTGVSKGSAVLFNGIRVGEVSRLAINRDDPRYVDVLLSIDPHTPIRTNTDISVGYQGLTGVGFIQMQGGTADAANILQTADTNTIPQVDGARSGVDDLLVSARSVMARVETAAISIEGFVTQNREPLSRSVANIARFSDAMADNTENVRVLLENAGSAAQRIEDVSVNVERFVSTIDSIARAIDPNKLQASLDNVENLTENLVGASNDFRALIDNTKQAADQLGEFSSGLNVALGNVKTVIDAVDAQAVMDIVSNVSTFADRLTTTPQDFNNLISDARAAMQGLNVFSAALSENADGVGNIIGDVSSLATQLTTTARRADRLLGQLDGSAPVPRDTLIAAATRAATSIADTAEHIDTRLIDEAGTTLAGLRTAIERLQSDTVEPVSRAAHSIRQLADRINTDLIDEIAGTSASVRRTIDRFDAGVVEDISTAAAAVRNTAERIDEDITPDIVAAARSIREVAESLDSELVHEATNAAKSVNATAVRIGNNVGELMNTIDRTTRAIETELRNFRLKGGSQLESLMHESRQAMRRINNLAHGLETNPARAVLGRGNVRKFKGNAAKNRY